MNRCATLENQSIGKKLTSGFNLVNNKFQSNVKQHKLAKQDQSGPI